MGAHLQFNVRLCPALQDKAKAKSEALAKVRGGQDGSPDAKRQRKEDTEGFSDGSNGKQNSKEPFKPPYVEELFVGALKGLDGEKDMSALVRLWCRLWLWGMWQCGGQLCFDRLT